jgi:hypothetical protein
MKMRRKQIYILHSKKEDEEDVVVNDLRLFSVLVESYS